MRKYSVCKARGNSLDGGSPYTIPEEKHSGNFVVIKETGHRIAIKILKIGLQPVELLIFNESCCGFAGLRLISLTLDFVCFNTTVPLADVWHHNTFPMSSSDDSSVTALFF
jgi:hypothetical protein